jgi:hypothetical protein
VNIIHSMHETFMMTVEMIAVGVAFFGPVLATWVITTRLAAWGRNEGWW